MWNDRSSHGTRWPRRWLRHVSLAVAGSVMLAAGSTPLLAVETPSAAAVASAEHTVAIVHSGSGVVIDPSGLVLTNHHVSHAQGPLDEWTIGLADGRQLPAELLGIDPVADLALLRLISDQALDLPAISLAPTEALHAGAPAVAIGNPFGLADPNGVPTLTAGVLAGGRIARQGYGDCVQFDAPVNPGNSGGPLIDGEGRLLGINGQIRTRTGLRANSGIGLAIAAPQIAAFLPLLQAAEGGYVHHASLPDSIEFEQAADGSVVVVAGAEQAALQAGDRVLQIAGRRVFTVDGAIWTARSLPWLGPDTVIPLQIQRGDATVAVTVPAVRLQIPGRPNHGIRLTGGRNGEPVTLRMVEPGTAAAKAGLSEGMQIVGLDDASAESRLALLRRIAQWEVGDRVVVHVRSPIGDTLAVPLLLHPE